MEQFDFTVTIVFPKLKSHTHARTRLNKRTAFRKADASILKIPGGKKKYGPTIIDDFGCGGNETNVNYCSVSFSTGCQTYAKAHCKGNFVWSYKLNNHTVLADIKA